MERFPVPGRSREEEVEGDYEMNTGKVIVEAFRDLDYRSMPGVLVNGHGPFTWGKDGQGGCPPCRGAGRGGQDGFSDRGSGAPGADRSVPAG